MKKWLLVVLLVWNLVLTFAAVRSCGTDRALVQVQVEQGIHHLALCDGVQRLGRVHDGYVEHWKGEINRLDKEINRVRWGR